jgi:hypothetical protein
MRHTCSARFVTLMAAGKLGPIGNLKCGSDSDYSCVNTRPECNARGSRCRALCNSQGAGYKHYTHQVHQPCTTHKQPTDRHTSHCLSLQTADNGRRRCHPDSVTTRCCTECQLLLRQQPLQPVTPNQLVLIQPRVHRPQPPCILRVQLILLFDPTGSNQLCYFSC